MTVQAFNTAANAAQPYVFDLDREVAAFYRLHPEQKKKLFFIDASTLPGALSRGDEADEDEVAELLQSNGRLKAAIDKTYITGMAGAVRYTEEGYGCVILKMPRNQSNVNLLGYSAPSDAADVFSFDHEAGHLLCPGGIEGDPRMKECIADAYAVIRYFQRFGADADCIKNLPAMRTVEMILGRDDGHFTAPVVEKVIADGIKGKFAALTPEQTVAEAVRYAKENAMDAQLISYMASNFTGRLNTKRILLGDVTGGMLGNLGAFVLKTEIPEEFKWGAVAVRALLEGNIGVDGRRLRKPEGLEWTKLRQAIDARAAKFEQPQRSKLILVSTL